MNCSKHTKEVAGITDMAELAKMIGYLHYETLYDLLDCIAVRLHKDGIKDFDAGREKLGQALQNASLNIQKSRSYMYEAWQVCKPFMKTHQGK